jgi:hypothetical protein
VKPSEVEFGGIGGIAQFCSAGILRGGGSKLFQTFDELYLYKDSTLVCLGL